MAAVVETSADRDVLRRIEGLLAELRIMAGPEGSGRGVHAQWLLRAGGLEAGEEKALESWSNVAEAWTTVAARAGLTQDALADRVAKRLGLEVADLGSRRRSAARLIPEVLVAAGRLVPLREDGETITVATFDPTSLATELELERLTGRVPVLQVATPHRIDAILGEILGDAPGERVPEPAPVRPILDQPRTGGREVLVVDDEPSARLLTRTLLEKRGYDVSEAGDGVEALEVMGSNDAIGLVVADLNMPRMDGLELMWELRDVPSRRDVPVIVVTGEKDEILETQLMEEGADDYIRKPVDPRLFLARVEATIRRTSDA